MKIKKTFFPTRYNIDKNTRISVSLHFRHFGITAVLQRKINGKWKTIKPNTVWQYLHIYDNDLDKIYEYLQWEENPHSWAKKYLGMSKKEYDELIGYKDELIGYINTFKKYINIFKKGEII